MNIQLFLYVNALVAGAAILLVIAVFASTRRWTVAGIAPFITFLIAMSIWTLGYAVELQATTLESKTFWAQVQYIGIVIIPAAWLVFMREYTTQAPQHRPQQYALLLLEPILVLVLVWTNSRHQLIWQTQQLATIDGIQLLTFEYGPAFWMHVIYSYALLLGGTIIAARALILGNFLLRSQAVILLVACIIPWIGNMIYLFPLGQRIHFDLTIIGFVNSGILVAWGIFRHQLLEIVPVAQDMVVRTLQDGVLVVDERGRIVNINPAGQYLLNLDDRAIGRPLPSPLAEICRIIPSLQFAVGNHGELVLYTKDGEAHLVDLSVSPFATRGKRVAGYLVLLRDVTKLKQAEEMLRAVLNTAGEAIFALDDRNRIVVANQVAVDLFGYSRAELLAINLDELLASPEDSLGPPLLDLAAMGGQHLEMIGLRADGNPLPVEVHISQAQLASATLYTVAIRNMTRQKELDKLRDEFVSTVSHELRTPLAAIMGWTETLLDGRPGPLTEPQHRFLTIIHESGVRLNEMVEELLTVSRIQRGVLRLQTTSFTPAHLLQSLCDTLQEAADAQQIDLTVENRLPPGFSIEGDRKRLAQVLHHLVDNAIKFSPHQSKVEVASWTDDRRQWCLSVTDYGMGIPEDERYRVFQRFFRARNAQEAQIRGSGLGLFICRAVVDAHGGDIGFESEPGVQTHFWFTIPQHPAQDDIDG